MPENDLQAKLQKVYPGLAPPEVPCCHSSDVGQLRLLTLRQWILTCGDMSQACYDATNCEPSCPGFGMSVYASPDDTTHVRFRQSSACNAILTRWHSRVMCIGISCMNFLQKRT